MGIEGLGELMKFVQEGGTLITEGSTATIFPEYGITAGVTVEEPAQLFVRGSILRAKITRHEEPDQRTATRAPICRSYFNQSPVLNARAAGSAGSAAAVDAAARRGRTPTAGSART